MASVPSHTEASTNMTERKKRPRVAIEAIESETMKGRYHYRAVNTPDFFGLGPNHSRSLRTWATKKAAIRAGLREYPGSYSVSLERPLQ
jgi:hypothetical protein